MRSLIWRFSVGLCCACGPGLPDTGQPEYYNFTVMHWKVEDSASGTELTSGCRAASPGQASTAGLIRFHVQSGQRVTSTFWMEGGSKDEDRRDSVYLCSTEGDDARRHPVATTVNLECWTFAEPAPVRVISAEILPYPWPENVQGLNNPPQSVIGYGRRFELEVLGPGVWQWEPSGLCTFPARTELEVLPP